MVLLKRYKSNVKVITSFPLLETNIIGKKTPRLYFFYHIGAGDHCTLKSIRPFLMRVKTVQEDWSVQKTMRIRVPWKINLWTLSWPISILGVNWACDNTAFYCLLKKNSFYRIFRFDKTLIRLSMIFCWIKTFFCIFSVKPEHCKEKLNFTDRKGVREKERKRCSTVTTCRKRQASLKSN